MFIWKWRLLFTKILTTWNKLNLQITDNIDDQRVSIISFWSVLRLTVNVIVNYLVCYVNLVRHSLLPCHHWHWVRRQAHTPPVPCVSSLVHEWLLLVTFCRSSPSSQHLRSVISNNIKLAIKLKQHVLSFITRQIHTAIQVNTYSLHLI